jgi:acyl-CoA synthetase (AMP-forming)/AMP-acid ligase II
MTDDPALGANLITRINVGDSLTRTAARWPDRLAVVDGARSWTYAQLNRRVNLVANTLAGPGYGYAPGDAVALASGNSCEFLVTYYACAKLGLICVPINLGWQSGEIAYVLEHSEARAIVVEAQLVALVTPALEKVPTVRDIVVAYGTGTSYEQARPDRRWLNFADLHGDDEREPEVLVADSDPISYLYTSGTTSAPKGVIGSHKAIYLESSTSALETGLRPDDRIAALMPLFHTAQLNGVCTPAVLVGATIYLLRGFDPDELLELIEQRQITQMFVLPTMYRVLVERPDIRRRGLSSLRRAAYAMAPMPDALLRECLDVFGCDFALSFGQTEMSPVTTYFRPEHQLSHPGAVGTQVINVQIEIMGADGELLARGEEGEIVYRGPHALNGYLKDPEATREAFAHGWFHSGDIGRLDPDGMLWFTDRRKDVIKTGGENVASIEVEKALYEAVPGIGEVVVIGLPHPRWSEAITAVVVPRPGVALDEAELIAAVKQHVDGYKAPKSVIVVAELPKTSTGKIQKNVLRERYATHYEV